LPADWPAIEAQQLFRSLHATHREAAEAQAREILDLTRAAATDG
jgi:hypothetical protein